MSSSSRRARHTRRVIPGEQAGTLTTAALVTRLEDLPPPPGEAAPVDGMLDEVRRRAFDEGYRAAREAAPPAAPEEARTAALRQLAAQVEEAAARVAEERQAIVDEAVGDAVDLVLELVGVLLGREVEGGVAPSREVLVRALALVPGGEDLVVRLPPGSALDDEEVRRLCPPHVEVAVVEDPAVAANGCVVETGRCRIDAQLSSALERVRQQLEPLRHRDLGTAVP